MVALCAQLDAELQRELLVELMLLMAVFRDTIVHCIAGWEAIGMCCVIVVFARIYGVSASSWYPVNSKGCLLAWGWMYT